jgi:hypothetical protein
MPFFTYLDNQALRWFDKLTTGKLRIKPLNKLAGGKIKAVFYTIYVRVKVFYRDSLLGNAFSAFYDILVWTAGIDV